MSTYFSHFPTIEYDGVRVRDIMRRTSFVQSNLVNPYVFLPYTIKQGEKPEDIAYHYYGSVSSTWLVLMANDIIDPYTQWPLDTEMFHQHLIEKYSDQSGLTGYDVIAWTQREGTWDNIVRFFKRLDNGDVLFKGKDSFPYVYDEHGAIVEQIVEEGWVAQRIYDYENVINENKREIVIVDKQFLHQITKEFKDKISR
jgi:hypothetical protein